MRSIANFSADQREETIKIEGNGCLISIQAVCLSMVTLDSNLSRSMEPRPSPPSRRLAAMEALSQAGVLTGVLVAPVIPGLTEHEIPAILAAAARARAGFADYVLLRLPLTVGTLFEDWLQRQLPHQKEKILKRIKETRGGKLYDSRFGIRLKGEGVFAAQIRQLFAICRQKESISAGWPQLSNGAFRTTLPQQRSLFEGSPYSEPWLGRADVRGGRCRVQDKELDKAFSRFFRCNRI